MCYVLDGYVTLLRLLYRDIPTPQKKKRNSLVGVNMATAVHESGGTVYEVEEIQDRVSEHDALRRLRDALVERGLCASDVAPADVLAVPCVKPEHRAASPRAEPGLAGTAS